MFFSDRCIRGNCFSLSLDRSEHVDVEDVVVLYTNVSDENERMNLPKCSSYLTPKLIELRKLNLVSLL